MNYYIVYREILMLRHFILLFFNNPSYRIGIIRSGFLITCMFKFSIWQKIVVNTIFDVSRLWEHFVKIFNQEINTIVGDDFFNQLKTIESWTIEKTWSKDSQLRLWIIRLHAYLTVIRPPRSKIAERVVWYLCIFPYYYPRSWYLNYAK